MPTHPSCNCTHRLISHADISEETNICTLLVNLWILSQKYGVLEQKLMVGVCVHADQLLTLFGSMCVAL